MKKTIAILLVAIMAVSSVFALDATLSGKFTSKLAYDLEDNWLGFSEPDNKLSLTLALSTATENEGDIYALVKADMNLVWDATRDDGAGLNEGLMTINDDDSKFEISEVGIYGQGWNLSILKAAEMPKYATGWETYNDGDDSIDLAAPAEYKDDLGLTLTIDNLLKAGVAMNIDFDKDAPKNALAWVSTNDLNFAGVVVNGAVGVKKVAGSGITYVGLGLDAGYENDTLSATVASDMSIGVPTKDEIDATFDLDVATNVNFADMVSVDAYYASQTELATADDTVIDTYEADMAVAMSSGGFDITVNDLGRGFIALSGEDYLSAKVSFDMNAFDVPVALTLAAMDIVNNPYIDLEAAVAVAGFDITAFAGYQYLDDLAKSNAIHVGAEVAYTIEPVGKLSVGTTFATVLLNKDETGLDDTFNAMSLELGLENTTLVSGATLKAGYKTPNLLDNEIGGMKLETADMGEVYVSATIEF